MSKTTVQVGAALSLAVLFAALAVGLAERGSRSLVGPTIHGSGNTGRPCQGAAIALSVTLRDPPEAPSGILVVDDPERRRWQLAAGEFDRDQLDARNGHVETDLILDDSDYGAIARVRPLGEITWCQVKVDLIY